MNCVPLTVVSPAACGRDRAGEEEVPVGALRSPGAAAAAPCRSPCAAGWSCPSPGRPARRASSPCSPRGRPGACSAGREIRSSGRASRGSPRARRPAPPARRTSPGWPRAGRRARTCCTGCRRPDPRPGSPARCCASRSAASRSASTVDGHRADRHQVALLGQQPRGDLLDEFRGAGVGRRNRGDRIRVRRRGNRDLVQAGQRRVDRGEVHLHDLLALLAVGLGDRLLDLGDGLVLAAGRRRGRKSRSAGPCWCAGPCPAACATCGGVDRRRAGASSRSASPASPRQPVPGLGRAEGAS